MPKLSDLDPEWISHGCRKGLGVAFNCMVGSHEHPYHGKNQQCLIRNWILFANPLDGGDPWPGNSRSLILEMVQNESDREYISGCGTSRWKREGDTFGTLSMTPSVNAHSCGHYTLTNGVFS